VNNELLFFDELLTPVLYNQICTLVLKNMFTYYTISEKKTKFHKSANFHGKIETSTLRYSAQSSAGGAKLRSLSIIDCVTN